MASTNIPVRFTDQQQKSLDERTALAGKDSRSDYIRDSAFLFDDDEFAVLATRAAGLGISVDDFVRHMVSVGIHYSENADAQAELVKLEITRLQLKSDVDRSLYSLVVQLVGMVNNLVSEDIAKSSHELAKSKTDAKFSQLDVVESVLAKISPGLLPADDEAQDEAQDEVQHG